MSSRVQGRCPHHLGPGLSHPEHQNQEGQSCQHPPGHGRASPAGKTLLVPSPAGKTLLVPSPAGKTPLGREMGQGWSENVSTEPGLAPGAEPGCDRDGSSCHIWGDSHARAGLWLLERIPGGAWHSPSPSPSLQAAQSCGAAALPWPQLLRPSQQRVLCGSTELAADQELGDVMQRKNTKGRPWRRQGELEGADDTWMEPGAARAAWGAHEWLLGTARGPPQLWPCVLPGSDLLGDLGRACPSQGCQGRAGQGGQAQPHLQQSQGCSSSPRDAPGSEPGGKGSAGSILRA